MSAIYDLKKSRLEKGYRILRLKTLILVVLSLIFSSIYTYLGTTDAHFPSWGSPFLITMGSLGIVSSSILVMAISKIILFKNYKFKAQIISILIHSILGILISMSYIYLGSLNGQFSSLVNAYLIIMGGIGIVSTVILGLFMTNIISQVEHHDKLGLEFEKNTKVVTLRPLHK